MKQLVSILFLSTLLISGCAHKKHIEAGDQYVQQGRYELAIRAYEEALNSRKNDKKTRQKLVTAKTFFSEWLLQINEQAVQAEYNEQLEVALLLHAKLASQGSYASKQAFKRLYGKVRPNVVYQVYLENQSGIDLTQSLQTHPDLQLANRELSSNNGVNLSLNLGQEQFSITEKNIVRSGEFLDGYRKEENPEFHSLNHDIDHAESKIRKLDRDWRKSDDKVRRDSTEVRLLEKDQEIWTLKLEQLAPESSAAIRLEAKLRKLERVTLPDAKSTLRQSEKRKTQIDNDLQKYKKKKRRLLERFRHTTPTIDIPVYSNLKYPVQVMTKHVSGPLKLSTNNGKNINLVIRTEHTDEGHDTIPLLNLDADPIQLNTDLQMQLNYQAKATEDAMLTILRWKDIYRRNLASDALNAQSPDQRTTLFVRYLLSGQISDPAVVAQFKQQLTFTYGQAGEFDIPMILQW